MVAVSNDRASMLSDIAATADERGGSCVLCWRRDPDNGPACHLCRSRLAAKVWEIRDLHALLGAALSPGQGEKQRISGSREAPLPLRVDALDFAEPARRPIEGVSDPGRDQRGVWSVAAVLDSWVRDWAELLDVPLPSPLVPDLVSWLSRNLQWAVDNHPAIEEFNDEVTAMLYALRALLNVSKKPIYLHDPCPTCGLIALKRDPAGGDVECGNCHRAWKHEEFERLAVVLADEGEAA